MVQRETADTREGDAGGSSARRTPRTHGVTMADVARLDRVRQKVMRGRRFQINSADLLHEARREAGRE